MEENYNTGKLGTKQIGKKMAKTQKTNPDKYITLITLRIT